MSLSSFDINYTLALKRVRFLFALSILWNNLYKKKIFCSLKLLWNSLFKNHQNLCLNNFYTFYLENCPCFLSFRIIDKIVHKRLWFFKLIEFLVYLFMLSFFTLIITLRQLSYSSFLKNQILVYGFSIFVFCMLVIFCSYMLLLFSSLLISKVLKLND